VSPQQATDDDAEQLGEASILPNLRPNRASRFGCRGGLVGDRGRGWSPTKTAASEVSSRGSSARNRIGVAPIVAAEALPNGLGTQVSESDRFWQQRSPAPPYCRCRSGAMRWSCAGKPNGRGFPWCPGNEPIRISAGRDVHWDVPATQRIATQCSLVPDHCLPSYSATWGRTY